MLTGGAFEPDRARCHHVTFMSLEDQIGLDEPPAAVEGELVDALPVLAEVRVVERTVPSVLPAVQAAAAAATGFVAGAATIALFKRHSARKNARAKITNRRVPNGLPIAESRSFLVDVHLIAKPGE
jgi:hypothetical protein